MNSEIAATDGFDFPLGNTSGKGPYTDEASGKKPDDGWFIATQFGEEYSLGLNPGEDWNGAGGTNTDLGQEV